MRRALTLFWLLIPALALSQTYTTVTASDVLVDNGSGTAINPPSGSSLCFLGVNTAGAAITYTPSGGSPVSGTVCQTLTSGGALTGSLQVANPATASPLGLLYTITVINGGTTYLTIPTVSFSGTLFNFDNFAVTGTGSALGIGKAHLACANGAQWTSTTLPPGQNAQLCNNGGHWNSYPPAPYCPAGQAYLIAQSGGSPMCLSPALSGLGSPSGTCVNQSTYLEQDNSNYYACKNATWVLIGSGASGGPPGGATSSIQINSGSGTFQGSSATADMSGNLGILSLNGAQFANKFATGGSGTSSSPWTSASGTGGIQEAVNAAEALPVVNGGFAPIVYLPAGNYAVNSSILVTKSVNIVGSGWASQIVPGTVGAPAILIQPTGSAEVKGFTFSDFTIQANASGGCGITLDGTSNVIAWGDIRHVQIYQQGSNAICAFGSGLSQGTPVLTTIEDSQLMGGISMTQGGDSNRIIHNTLSGTGGSDLGNFAGAVGFIFEHNNVTSTGGVHFGNTVTLSVNYYDSILYNEFETPAGFSGSNGAMLDLDQNVVGPTIAGNSFSILHGTNPVALRLNNAVSGILRDNKFPCTNAGITGTSTGVLATASAAHNIMMPENYFIASNPCSTNVSATSFQVQYVRSNLGSGFYMPSTQFLGSSDASGNLINLLGLDSSNNAMLEADGAFILKSFAADTPNFRTDFYDSSPSHNLGMEIASAFGSNPTGSSTYVKLYNLNLNAGGNIYDNAANILVPGNAGGHTGLGKMVEQTSPNLLMPSIGPLGNAITSFAFFTTGSITPTAVTAQTCSDQTFTVTNLATGDRISQITPPSALGNISLAGYVSATNTILLHFCNPTAVSVTPPVGAYLFTATH